MINIGIFGVTPNPGCPEHKQPVGSKIVSTFSVFCFDLISRDDILINITSTLLS
jgi:hypothetical protein